MQAKEVLVVATVAEKVAQLRQEAAVAQALVALFLTIWAKWK